MQPQLSLTVSLPRRFVFETSLPQGYSLGTTEDWDTINIPSIRITSVQGFNYFIILLKNNIRIMPFSKSNQPLDVVLHTDFRAAQRLKLCYASCLTAPHYCSKFTVKYSLSSRIAYIKHDLLPQWGAILSGRYIKGSKVTGYLSRNRLSPSALSRCYEKVERSTRPHVCVKSQKKMDGHLLSHPGVVIATLGLVVLGESDGLGEMTGWHRGQAGWRLNMLSTGERCQSCSQPSRNAQEHLGKGDSKRTQTEAPLKT